jgi:hypothetical protein
MHFLLELPAHGQRGVQDSPIYIRVFAVLLFLTHVVLGQEPTPIVPDPKLTHAIKDRVIQSFQLNGVNRESPIK